jgi:DNA-binding response OmpR family regulator
MKPRILVMDDDDSLQRMYKLMLDRLGCESDIVGRGEDALAHFADARKAGTPFDVVILDLTVHDGMGGAEAIVELRKVAPDVYAVVASGSSKDSLRMMKGFNDTLPKPFRLQELTDCIRKAGVQVNV